MDNVVCIATRTDVMSVYKQAMLEPALAQRLAWLRGDKTIAAQGPYVVGDCAMRWAQECLNESKAAGAIAGYEPCDMLALASMALSAVIVEEYFK